MAPAQLKVAVRGLLRDRGFTALNVSGLAIGLAVFLILFLTAAGDLGYDRWRADADRIFRVAVERTVAGETTRSAATPRPLAGLIAEAVPGPVAITRVSAERAGRVEVRTADETFFEQRIRFADASVFEVFETEFLTGRPDEALAEPFSIVLTRSFAARIFGQQDVLGRTVNLRLQGDGTRFDYTVTGVVEDQPAKTHLPFTALAAYNAHPLVGEPDDQDNWLGLDLYTYVRLGEGVNASGVESAIDEAAAPVVRERITEFADDATGASGGMAFSLQPVTRIHLHSNLSGELESGADATQTGLLLLIACMVLGLACINFTNLSIARSMRRVREIGVRRVLGSTRTQLIRGFLAEAVVTVLPAVVIAIALVETGGEWISGATGAEIGLPYLSGWFLLLLFAILAGTTLLAGLYPALWLSRPRPVRHLLARNVGRGSNARLRTALIAVQFAASALLLTGTLAVREQLEFLQSADAGFDPDHVLVIEGTESIGQRIGALRRELGSIGSVDAVGTGQAAPGDMPPSMFVRREAAAEDDRVQARWLTVTAGYVESLGIRLAAGRSFEAANPTDSTSVLLNREAARQLGLVDPVGETIIAENRPYRVAGLVEDYHYVPLVSRIEPLVLFGPDPNNRNRPHQVTTVRFSSTADTEASDAVARVWRDLVPGQPFRAYLLSERLASLYPGAERMRLVGSLGALFALLIAGTGLLGVAAYWAERRRKEIGIRKVLGATARDVHGLLMRDFLIPIAIALVIAAPVGWIASRAWLQSFAYHVSLDASIVVVSAAVCLLTAGAALLSQGIRASRWEPARHLKEE